MHRMTDKDQLKIWLLLFYKTIVNKTNVQNRPKKSKLFKIILLTLNAIAAIRERPNAMGKWNLKRLARRPLIAGFVSDIVIP